jgi:guanylate kinase
MKKGKLFIISGASGVGKSTVLNKIMKLYPDLRFSVSVTTRAPRNGEVDGVDYDFITMETFEQMVKDGAFVEYDLHMDCGYGTPRAQLEEKMLNAGVILDIEPNGAFNVRKEYTDATLIFIAPPSFEELERRLRSRGDTSEEQIVKRLTRAKWEIEQSVHYDHVVVNDEVDTCMNKIIEIITKKLEEN